MGGAARRRPHPGEQDNGTMLAPDGRGAPFDSNHCVRPAASVRPGHARLRPGFDTVTVHGVPLNVLA